MATYLLFDGALNTAILGLPAYIWIILLFVILIAFSNAIWYFFFWHPLKAVQGHFRAHLYHINSALTFTENLVMRMVSEKNAKLIFDMPVKDAKEEQKDWEYAPSGLIGRVLNDLIFDGGRWTDTTSPVRALIEQVAGKYNDMNPDDQVLSLDKFHRYLVAGKFNGIEGVSDIKPWYRVPWKRIDMAFPEDHEQPMWDGYLRQLARQKDNDQNADYTMYGYLILGISALICIGMIVSTKLG